MTHKLKVTQFGTERAAVYAKQLGQRITPLKSIYDAAIAALERWLKQESEKQPYYWSMMTDLNEFRRAAQTISTVIGRLPSAKTAPEIAKLMGLLDRAELTKQSRSPLRTAVKDFPERVSAKGRNAKRDLVFLLHKEDSLLNSVDAFYQEVVAVSGKDTPTNRETAWKPELRPLARDTVRIKDMIESLETYLDRTTLLRITQFESFLAQAARERNYEKMLKWLYAALKHLTQVNLDVTAAYAEDMSDPSLKQAYHRMNAFVTRFRNIAGV